MAIVERRPIRPGWESPAVEGTDPPNALSEFQDEEVVPVIHGGTGAIDETGARSNLDVYSTAETDAVAVAAAQAVAADPDNVPDHNDLNGVDAGDVLHSTAAEKSGYQEGKDHADITSGNPHGTTAGDVGADPSGSAAAVQNNLDAHVADGDIHFSDAPADTKIYARQDNAWVEVGSGGASSWLALSDTPSSYSGFARNVSVVNAAEDGMEFGLRTKWRNKWAAGTYYAEEMVRDGAWLMMANKETTDRAAPQSSGEGGWSLDDNPTWSTSGLLGAIYSGVEFTCDQLTEVNGFRFWSDQDGSNVSYRVWFFDVTDNSNQILLGDLFINGNQADLDSWNEIPTEPFLVPSGTRLRVVLEKQFQNSELQGGPYKYFYNTTSNSGTGATLGRFQRNWAHTLLWINQIDNDGVDRSSELSNINGGDSIRTQQENDARAYHEYTVTGAALLQTDRYQIPVILNDSGNNIPDNTDAQIAWEIADAGTTSYVFITDYWLTSEPPEAADVKGFVTTDYGQGDSLPYDDNAYGVDLLLEFYDVSPDWDFMALSGIRGSSSGTSESQCLPFVLTDGTQTQLALSNGQLPFVLTDGTEIGLSVVPCSE